MMIGVRSGGGRGSDGERKPKTGRNALPQKCDARQGPKGGVTGHDAFFCTLLFTLFFAAGSQGRGRRSRCPFFCFAFYAFFPRQGLTGGAAGQDAFHSCGLCFVFGFCMLFCFVMQIHDYTQKL